MSILSLAYNRFGLGARGDDMPPADPRRWLIAQFDLYEPRPAPIAAAPARAEIATRLADYLEETRMARVQARRGETPAPDGSEQERGRRQSPPEPGMAMRNEAAPVAGPAMEPNDQLAGLPDNARRFIRGASRDYYLAMVGARTDAALVAPAPFVERMVHFWANHFAV